MPRPIRAAVSPGLGKPPVIEDLILADPEPDEVVLRIEAAGICHTDLEVARWTPTPRVLGHEGAGVVVATGSAVTGLSPGDRVVATFGFCGECPNCKGDQPAYCFDGPALNFEGKRGTNTPALTRPDGTAIEGAFFQQSSFATHALATMRNCVKVPDGFPLPVAAPLGCGIQTGAGAVANQLAARKGRPLLVIGAGAGIGGSVAKRFARDGYHAVLCRRSDEEGLQRLVREIADAGGTAPGKLLNAVTDDAIEDCIDWVEDTIGPIEVVLFNLGAQIGNRSLANTTYKQFELGWRMATFALFRVAAALFPRMETRGSGTLLVTSATAAVPVSGKRSG